MSALRLTPAGLAAYGRVIPVTLGRAGLRDPAAKSEGDAATPAAPLRITGCLWRPDRLPRPAPWAEAILPGDLWCDAADSPAYNQPVRAPFAPSHEVMRRADPLYDIVLITDWNMPATGPHGSAIFLHQWRRPGYPTAGCIAMARDALIWLAARAVPGTLLHIPPLASAPFRPARHAGA